MAIKNITQLRSKTLILFLSSCAFSTFSYASETKNDSTSLIQRSINFLKEMSANAYKQAFEDKEKADPNDPRNDPRLKHYFGSVSETAPVEAVVKTGGITMTFKANEMVGGSLRPHPVLKESIGDHFTFALTYPDFKGKTEENFNDFYRKSSSEQENIWLNIIYKNQCGLSGDYGFNGPLYDNNPPVTFPLSDKDKERLIRHRHCNNTLKAAYGVYGEPKERRKTLYKNWKNADMLPALSKHFALDNIELRGFKGFHHSGDVNNTFTIEQRIYRYIPDKAHPETFEFMTCTMSDRHQVPLKDVVFKNHKNYSCTYYFPFLKRAQARIWFREDHVKEWLKIRNGVYKFFEDKVISVDDYVPSHYTYDENKKPIPISLSIIDDLTKEEKVLKGDKK